METENCSQKFEFTISERPADLNSIAGNSVVKEQFKRFFANKTLPHKILITGKSGTGKTTLCQIIKSYLKINEDFNLHYIDCGSQKDVATARDTVKIMNQNVIGGSQNNAIFILEEVHRLSKNVQEVYLPSLESISQNKYVIATTDQPEMLIETFRSRFMMVQLKPLSAQESSEELLLPVVNKYQIRVKKSTLNKITYMADGNNRTALSLLTAISEVPPEKHDDVLNVVDTKSEDVPIYKQLKCLFTFSRLHSESIYDLFKQIMQQFLQSGKEAEAVRQCILLKCASIIKNPQSEVEIDRALCLTQLMDNVTCYGEIGWATLGRCIFEFLQTFLEN